MTDKKRTPIGRVGTRVRVTVDGSIVDYYDNGFLTTPDGQNVRPDHATMLVERLDPPEPEPLGSLVRSGEQIFVRRQTGTREIGWEAVSWGGGLFTWVHLCDSGPVEILYVPS